MARLTAMRHGDGRHLKAYFLGWQCRIRQMSVRELDGRPMPGMRPRVVAKAGAVIAPAVTVLLLPLDCAESTAFLKFQVQRTNEPEEARTAALRYFAADYFQLPERFSDEMAAVFAAGSQVAAKVLRAKPALLEFEQYSQAFRLPCRARRLDLDDPARAAAFWQARLFNPNLPGNVEVLGFKPDWRTATATPMP